MMWVVYAVTGVSLTAALLTLLVGLIHKIAIVTLLERCLGLAVVFGTVTYFFVLYFRKHFFLNASQCVNSLGKNVDIKSEASPESTISQTRDLQHQSTE